MLISNAAIKNRATVLVLIVMIVIVGAYSYVALPREAAPDVKIPRIIVTTSYEGVSPADIETLVTREIEAELSGLDGVKEIRSYSAEGISTVIIEFLPDVDEEQAKRDVKDKVDKAELPLDAEEPDIAEINVAEFPIVMVNISGEVSPVVLKEIADQMSDAVKAHVAGVLDVNVSGALEWVVRIEIDPDRVAAYGLTVPELMDLIGNENVNISAGGLETEGTKFNIRVPSQFGDPADIDDLQLTVREGKPIYLKDVAAVVYTFKDRQTYSRLDCRSSLTLSVQKRIGQNIIPIVEGVKTIIEEFRRRAPEGVEFEITLDLSEDIRMLVADLENNIVSGLVLVVAVLVLFMGWRTSAIVALAIPMSMLISFALIRAFGYTLNTVVLFSLTLALGMLVDNAIVIVENIFRFRQMGCSRVEAATKGTGQVAWPVITSTATTLAAFSPLVFWSGVMGDFMKYLPITLIITLSSSLFVAMVISPTICSLVSGGQARTGRQAHPFVRRYRGMLAWALNHKSVTLGTAFAVLAGMAALYAVAGRGKELFPDIDPRQAICSIRCPQGTNIRETNRLTKVIEGRMWAYRADLQHMVANVGAEPGAMVAFGAGVGGPHVANITLVFKDFEDRHRPSAEVIAEMRKDVAGIPGTEIKLAKQQEGPPTGAAVTIHIIGEDFKQLQELSKAALDALNADPVPGMVNLRSDYEASRPELAFVIDRHRAMQCGMSTNYIGQYLKMHVFGRKVGTYHRLDDEDDITVRAPLDYRRAVEDLEHLQMPNLAGKSIPLTNFGRFEYTGGYGTITRLDQKRVITLTADVEGRQDTEVLKDVQARLAELELPAGCEIRYAGRKEEEAKAQAFLSKAFVVALLLIVMILVTQFNTLSVPLIIMTTVLLSLIGVLAGLLICRMPFGIIMTGVGVISLAGVVVNNAIVLLDCTRQLQRRGAELVQAVLQAGATRLRPVLLTATTTILGLIPMATGVSFDIHKFVLVTRSESSQWWSSMAVAVIFGLAAATLLTLIVVPTLYVCLYRLAASFGLGGLRKVGLEAGAQPPDLEDF